MTIQVKGTGITFSDGKTLDNRFVPIETEIQGAYLDSTGLTISRPMTFTSNTVIHDSLYYGNRYRRSTAVSVEMILKPFRDLSTQIDARNYLITPKSIYISPKETNTAITFNDTSANTTRSLTSITGTMSFSTSPFTSAWDDVDWTTFYIRSFGSSAGLPTLYINGVLQTLTSVNQWNAGSLYAGSPNILAYTLQVNMSIKQIATAQITFTKAANNSDNSQEVHAIPGKWDVIRAFNEGGVSISSTDDTGSSVVMVQKNDIVFTMAMDKDGTASQPSFSGVDYTRLLDRFGVTNNSSRMNLLTVESSGELQMQVASDATGGDIFGFYPRDIAVFRLAGV